MATASTKEPLHQKVTNPHMRPLANLLVKFLDAGGVTTTKTADLVMLVGPDGRLLEPQDNCAKEIVALLERIADRLDVISAQLED